MLHRHRAIHCCSVTSTPCVCAPPASLDFDNSAQEHPQHVASATLCSFYHCTCLWHGLPVYTSSRPMRATGFLSLLRPAHCVLSFSKPLSLIKPSVAARPAQTHTNSTTCQQLCGQHEVIQSNTFFAWALLQLLQLLLATSGRLDRSFPTAQSAVVLPLPIARSPTTPVSSSSGAGRCLLRLPSSPPSSSPLACSNSSRRRHTHTSAGSSNRPITARTHPAFSTPKT